MAMVMFRGIDAAAKVNGKIIGVDSDQSLTIALYFALHFNAPWWECILMAMIGGAVLGAEFLYLSGIEQWSCAQTALPNMGFNGIAAAFLGGIHPVGAVFSLFLSSI